MLHHRTTTASRVVLRPGHSRDRVPSLLLILAMATFWIGVIALDAFVRFSNHVHIVGSAVQ